MTELQRGAKDGVIEEKAVRKNAAKIRIGVEKKCSTPKGGESAPLGFFTSPLLESEVENAFVSSSLVNLRRIEVKCVQG